ncbi:Protein of uncharacterised function (DUF2743) [Salmonella enterica subsp. arizonae]|uniref:Protein of uncharacterized function (DUF2743) n=1 Tax=Salmonella enterica subsp. arizonae TaxID=59203 RepID=A0A447QWA2_SALER|nr:Protein of uncharacterised function (DUF2743) [Salmonella enterica subsp. arizonae]
MKPKSETLFHFTKSSDVLEVILEDGFWPRFCLEDVSWLGFTEYDYVSYPMVCFCDIPLSRISEHVDFYGSFGLGMSKDWAEKNGLNPVFYVSRSSATSKTLRKLNNPIIKLSDEDDVKKLKIQYGIYMLLQNQRKVKWLWIINLLEKIFIKNQSGAMFQLT